MAFQYEWRDENKRAMVYIVEGDWNWKDYHHVVRVSTFSMTGIEHPVDSVVDLRDSTRPTLPAGLLGHVRSFGRKKHPKLTGRALVIGLPPEGIKILQLLDNNTLPTSDGYVKFVDTLEDLNTVLDEWAENPPR